MSSFIDSSLMCCNTNTVRSMETGPAGRQGPPVCLSFGRWTATEAHLQDLIETIVLLHDLLLLRVQDGAADQQVEVLTGETRPHHLRREAKRGFPNAPSVPALCESLSPDLGGV